jgi:hypothetical protein
MFIIHIFSLVLRDLCSCRKTIQKTSKIKQLEAIGARWATMGHLVAPRGPTMASASVALQVPPHRSVGNGQETHPQAFSTIDSKSVHDQGPKRGITWIDDSPSGMSGAQLDKWCSYPHSTTPQGAPHQRRRAHSTMALRPAPYLRRPAPHFHSTASPSDTCKETHLGAILCVSLRRFIGGLIQEQGEDVTRIVDVAME